MFVEHKEAVEITKVPAKTLKLSEAIRIGASESGQCSSVYTDGENTCAIGAAYLGLKRDPVRLMNTQFKGWKNDPAACLHGPAFALSLAGIQIKDDIARQIVTKNDAGCTRESIADWLESQGY